MIRPPVSEAPPTSAACNGIDDNCDGIIDDGVATTCASPANLGTVGTGGSVTQTT